MEEAGCGVVAVVVVGPQAFIILLEFFILEAAMGGWVVIDYHTTVPEICSLYDALFLVGVITGRVRIPKVKGNVALWVLLVPRDSSNENGTVLFVCLFFFSPDMELRKRGRE